MGNEIDSIQKLVSSFQGGSIPLPALVRDLEALIALVDDKKLQALLLDAWGGLEDEYAYELDMGLSEPDEEGKKLIDKSIKELLAVISTNP